MTMAILCGLSVLLLIGAAAPAAAHWLSAKRVELGVWALGGAAACAIALPSFTPVQAAAPAPVLLVWALHAPDSEGDMLPPVEEVSDPAADSSALEAAVETPVAEAPLTAEQLSPSLKLEEEEAPTGPSAAKPSRIVELPADFFAPENRVVIPQRPEWVGSKQTIDDVFQQGVSSALELRPNQTRASLDQRLVQAVDDYIRQYLGNDQATMFIHYDAAEIRRLLADSSTEFSDVVETSAGKMHQSHVLLKITPEFRAALDARWQQVVQYARVLSTSGIALGVLVMLGMLFAYFRVDNATKGYYTRRLQMLLVAAILGVLAAGFLFTQSTAQVIYKLIM
jgi:hypothetical protein